jgi:hypothetical protein
VEILEGKSSTGRHMRRCEEYVKVNLRDRNWEGVDWNLLAL